MNPGRKSIRKYVNMALAVMTGILLLFLQVSVSLNAGIMDPQFHEELFIKHDIYSQAYNIIDSTIDDFINKLEDSLPASSESFHLQDRILENLENSITPDLIKTNLDLIREGVFQYFRGERIFLPDIHLSRETKEVSSHPVAARGSPNLASGNALELINKINLNAVLHYIGRNDITDNLHILKMFYFLGQRLPWLFILGIILLLLGGFALSKSFTEFSRWIAISCAVYGILGIVSGIALTFYTYVLMPEQIYPIVMSVPLESETIRAYLKDCLMYPVVFLVTTSAFFLALSVSLHRLLVKYPSIFSDTNQSGTIIGSKPYKIIKYTTYSLLFIVILTGISYKLAVFKKEFDSNNFSRAVSRLMNRTSIVQVIAASDDAVYSLHVNVTDKKENRPLPGIEMNITGKTTLRASTFDKTVITDENGFAKIKLDKGEYRLSFPIEAFPDDYILPSPVYLDLKKPGTTIITVGLEIDEEKMRPGVVEIEVLDHENKPVPNLELYVKESAGAQGEPDIIFSRTNSDGIAVFKLLEGSCIIDFTQSEFPEPYFSPGPMKASVVSGQITRYTIQLSKAEKQDTTVKDRQTE